MKRLVVVTTIATVECDVTKGELKEFVADALSTWGGQRHPDDPLFDSMDVSETTVSWVAVVE